MITGDTSGMSSVPTNLLDITAFSINGNGNGVTGWQIWQKPRNARMIFAIVVGGGGGGGGGFTGAAGTARGGGGGGGSGAVSRIIIPAFFLPDTLFVFCGSGGAGSTGSGVAGGAGTRSYISKTTVGGVSGPECLIISGANDAGGGGAGTGAAAGGAGAAGTISTGGVWGFGVGERIAGQIGALGGAQTGANGPSVTWGNTNLPISGGAGGGGTPIANTDFTGGSITGTIQVPTLTGGAAAGGAGRQGWLLGGGIADFKETLGRQEWASTGGSGGGTNGAAGVGGPGGQAQYGSGGGGGGAGVTGGTGGKGGDGFVVLVTW